MAADLTRALQPVVSSLVDDMRARLHDDDQRVTQWQAEYAKTKNALRTAMSFSEWEEDQLQQAAASWVLTTVFIRFIEDNRLFGERWSMISGVTEDARRTARDNEDKFYASNPDAGYRGYLQHVFGKLGQVDATKGLVDTHAAFHIMEPSDAGARQIMDFWRAVDDEGELLHPVIYPDAGDPLSTRFLGDMYEEMSVHAQKKWALKQTPEFVEKFILQRTMVPALAERPLEGFTMIDPTCGSGHFLFGAYELLLDRWAREAPARDAAWRAVEASKAIHGVDINPFAVSISKFRLMVQFMRAADETRLNGQLPEPEFTVLSGDSLYWGPGQELIGKDALPYGEEKHATSTEDSEKLLDVLAPGMYDAVVGNPPYIVVRDKALNTFYRKRYAPYCKGKYAMTAPFMVVFFNLGNNAIFPRGEKRGAGWVGQITSNSFEKREFGKPVIEEFFPKHDLREVIDTSGAYIPGHGTPTVILVGRNAKPSRAKVLGVLGIQGEPGVPKSPEDGLVWRSIVDHVENTGFENEYISVAELDRGFISTHPWNLQGGAAPDAATTIDSAATARLDDQVYRIGFYGVPGMEDAMFFPPKWFDKAHIQHWCEPILMGEDVRDYEATSQFISLHPYDKKRDLLSIDYSVPEVIELWPNRRALQERSTFSGGTYLTDDRPWYEWHQLPKDAGTSPFSIAFAFVATHNHFVLDRGGSVFKQSAPVIKLPENSTEDDHLALLGILNSSTACFWLKQKSHNKGVGGVGGGIGDEAWEPRYEFTGTTLKSFPLPDGDVTERGRRLDSLAQELAKWDPTILFEDEAPTRELIDKAHEEYTRIRTLMIAEQEELDWAVYHVYGLTDTDLSLPVGSVDGIELGTRPFEIALARSGKETAWFERHHSHPTTELPEGLSPSQSTAYARRLELIDGDRKLRLLESPEFKRRWADDPWDKKVTDALTYWLLGRLESRDLWFVDGGDMPRPRTIRELAGVIETDPAYADVLTALPLWAGKRARSTTDMLIALLKNEPVPFHKSLRYRKAGVRKRAEWEATWQAQRLEDAGEIQAADVPVPPNYTSADMPPAVWKHRGKLDVPKERFISYPGATRDGDGTDIIGWAGWNHLEQGLALMALVHEAFEADAAPEDIAALLSGMEEQLFWITMWHNDVDPRLGIRFGDYLRNQVIETANKIDIPAEDLPKYAPTQRTRSRSPRAKKEN